MMGKLITIPSLCLFIFISVFTTISHADICSFVNCGQGACKATALLGFECRCNPGWTKLQMGSFTWPTCLLPNCTVDFNCGLSPAPVAPPIAPFAPPLLDVLKPCGLVWCGEGKCVMNEAGYSCQCNDGSINLMRSSSLPCFRECHIGADCNGIHFGLPPLFPP